MGKTAHEIVRQFTRETGLALDPKGGEDCMRFAEILLGMFRDREKLTVTTRHCLDYAESVETGRISHATFYNNKVLKAMLDWAVSAYGREASAPEEGTTEAERPERAPKDLTEMEKTLREKDREITRLNKKNDAMGDDILRLNDLENENQDLRVRFAKSDILLERAKVILTRFNLSNMLDMTITPEQLVEHMKNQNIDIDQNTGEIRPPKQLPDPSKPRLTAAN